MMQNRRDTSGTRFFIETYGCQMNKYDSELISRILIDHGYTQASNADEADILIINTCSVREHAEQRVLGRIGVMAAWKRLNEKRRLIITGCMAQRLGETLIAIPHVDGVAGPDQYRLLPGLVNSKLTLTQARMLRQTHTEDYSDIKPNRETGISGWVAISRGCNNFCSYCIVPYVRGRERSRPFNGILDEVRNMANSGFQEVTLLGQNVNTYRDGATDFPRLLTEIAEKTNIKRIRFMTSHPRDLSLELLEVMGAYDSICPHIHLPVQAGSDSVLERMNRGYTRNHYLYLVEAARKRIPNAALTTDVMVGFPGETEKDFLETVNLMETVRFDDAFTYRYSSRPGTKAAEMAGQVEENEKSRRLQYLINIQRRITLQKRKSMIGSVVEVLPEISSKYSTREWMGRTPTDHVVVFPKNRLERGVPVPVRIDECRGATLRGSPVISPMA
ncbi:MAG TPA: tRNA (N6-isopentenyl adenosine(37)-C2)-methylthiotransferase MiaB [bacterium]|nr:tRNA (N6-isopentenyl adenosine(37)-C2)-methylthiotransferase MiaB [bacterium]